MASVMKARPPLALYFGLAALLAAAALAGCRKDYSYYLPRGFEQNREVRGLFELLGRETSAGETRYILINQIATRLLNSKETERLILFLTTYVASNPEDPYNAYYLGIVAAAYRDLKAVPMAVEYYQRILKNYPDLQIAGSSIHYQCLQELLKLVNDPRRQIDYYKELISRFSDRIDPGVSYYFLARAYEEIGDWEQAIRVYQKFLNYPEAEIPGFPRAHSKIREKVEFYYADKEWTVDNLERLVADIREALRTHDVREFLKYRAKVNFFTMSWSQQDVSEFEEVEVSTSFDLGALGAFLQSSRVSADDQLDVYSNSGEAYLRTTHWNYRIPTWYLYFRKVDFKPDPDINGRWEWAGIYLGEKF
jgi:tetratricopeptide (TPR) repeat protein